MNLETNLILAEIKPVPEVPTPIPLYEPPQVGTSLHPKKYDGKDFESILDYSHLDQG